MQPCVRGVVELCEKKTLIRLPRYKKMLVDAMCATVSTDLEPRVWQQRDKTTRQLALRALQVHAGHRLLDSCSSPDSRLFCTILP